MPVSYTKVGWKNRVVQRPRTYTETTNQDSSVTHTPAPGTVVQAGTPRSAENMDHMDQGIKDCADMVNTLEVGLRQTQTTLNTHNTRISNNERSITDIQRVNEQQSSDIARLTSAHNALAEDEEALEGRTDAHIAKRDNPHNVTKEQLGLGSVPNVSTNNQTPTYSEASSNQNLSSGETLSTAFGKIARGLKQLWTHIARTDNPHSVTKTQVGLGNVPNVTTNNQTPTYNQASTLANLSSGETLATAFGKISKAIYDFIAHLADEGNPHAVDLFQAAAQDFQNAWGDPAAVGTYIGNGSAQATLTVNSTSVRGQKIDLSFTPSKVAIFVPYTELTIGYSEGQLTQYNPLDVACGAKLGVVLIGPNLNYYHSGCGNLRTVAPQQVLRNNHGGAVVYGSSFIVQAFNNQDNDTTMRVNSKNARYMYMAWR